MKKILLLGSEGQIGWELQRTLTAIGEVHSFNRQGLDISDTAAVKDIVAGVNPEIIVNAAAYTAVDRAEADSDAAWRLNAEIPAFLASLSRERNSLLVHYSTDYVFDGSASTPYREDAPTGPLNTYGASKLAGEVAIRESGTPYLILRTSWIYAARGKNFLLTMLELAQRRSQLSVVADQLGSPTWARLVAQATAHLLQIASEPLWGTYHLTCRGSTSWHDFAGAIFNQWQELAGAFGLPLPAVPELKAIATSEYPTAAVRPRYSVLANDKLYKNFGIQLSDWQKALQLCLQELILSQRHNAQRVASCPKASS